MRPNQAVKRASDARAADSGSRRTAPASSPRAAISSASGYCSSRETRRRSAARSSGAYRWPGARRRVSSLMPRHPCR
ncbi:hypothetical protein [Thermocatellispora tengchongensis]|uniref:hypothetical protein n=1 Tax=Thermocatellispora tengchongensis TaxID=1073253 RepID=UPI0036416EDE